MPNTFGFGTDTTNFSNTIHTHIHKTVIDTLRAGLVSLPRGAVVPSVVNSQSGENFTMRVTEYPDLVDAAATNPLTEGVAPTPVKLGVSTQDYTVAQVGAWTKVTDIAQLQSPHPLERIAADKIARLAAQSIDGLGLAALAALTFDAEYATSVLSTTNLLDAKAEMESRAVGKVPGIGYYAITNPYALRGLEGEDTLNGYVDVTAAAKAGDLSTGVVSQYRGISFLTSPRVAGVLSSTARGALTGVAATDILTSTAHGLRVGERMQFVSLTGGTGLSTATDYWVIATPSADTFQVSATKGGASVNFTTDVTAGTFKSEVFPVYFLGASSVAFGDVSSITYHHWSQAGVGNELQQLMGVGFKGILGGAVLSFAETANGSGTNGSSVPRVFAIKVAGGLSS